MIELHANNAVTTQHSAPEWQFPPPMTHGFFTRPLGKISPGG